MRSSSWSRTRAPLEHRRPRNGQEPLEAWAGIGSSAGRAAPLQERRPARARNGGLIGTRMLRRVVITGLGLVTPLGCGVDASWSRLLAGQSGARRIEEFQADDLACQIACFVPRGPLSEGRFN